MGEIAFGTSGKKKKREGCKESTDVTREYEAQTTQLLIQRVTKIQKPPRVLRKKKKKGKRLKAERSLGMQKDGSTGLKNEQTAKCGQKYA